MMSSLLLEHIKRQSRSRECLAELGLHVCYRADAPNLRANQQDFKIDGAVQDIANAGKKISDRFTPDLGSGKRSQDILPKSEVSQSRLYTLATSLCVWGGTDYCYELLGHCA